MPCVFVSAFIEFCAFYNVVPIQTDCRIDMDVIRHHINTINFTAHRDVSEICRNNAFQHLKT